MTFSDLMISPISDFTFMRRALVACLALSLASAPIGVLLMLRRMSLVGDSMSHAILPGAAIGFLISGFSLPAMSLGGFIAGIAVALASGWVSQATRLREDSSFASFYLIALALGVLLISVNGTQVDLVHVLFGNVLTLDNESLFLIVTMCSLVILAVAVLMRAFVLESFDRDFLRQMGVSSRMIHSIFLVVVVTCLIASFQSLGTLLAVGLMMIPAATSRLLSSNLRNMILISVGVAASSSVLGLLISYHVRWPSGPAIVLCCGVVYFAALLFSPRAGLLSSILRRRHYDH